MKNRYLPVFILLGLSGILLNTCDNDSNIVGTDPGIEELPCIVQSLDAVNGYIAAWELCTRETAEELRRITLRSLDGNNLEVQVSDTLYSAYSPLLWENSGYLMVMYAENRDMDFQQSVHHANRIKLKKYTPEGELVSSETLLEVEPGTFGTFQLPFGKVKRSPNSTLVYWADNLVEGVSRTAHLVDIKNGEVAASRYLTGIRDMSTPHAILDGERYLFAFMSGLSLDEIEEGGIEYDINSIFLVETDSQFQPLGKEKIINVGGESDWGVRPLVSKLGNNYVVVFLSNDSPSPTLSRLNIRVYDPETESVIYSETDEQFTYLNHQIASDSGGNLTVFYTEAARGYSAETYNLRVKIMEHGNLQTADYFVMSLTNPNFTIGMLEGNQVRIYHGGTHGGDPISTRQMSLDSFRN